MKFHWLLIAALTLASPLLLAQTSKRTLDVTVKDPKGRLVLGFSQQDFEIIENGVTRRPVDAFTSSDSPITIAIVSPSPIAEPAGRINPQDAIIQTTSLDNALLQLAASPNPRKVLLIAGGINAPVTNFPVVIADQANLAQTVISLRSQYHLEFSSNDPAAKVEVTLKQHAGLPLLTINWQ